jgi:hypothetical protein
MTAKNTAVKGRGLRLELGSGMPLFTELPRVRALGNSPCFDVVSAYTRKCRELSVVRER